MSVNDITSVLKLYFRELPEPLLTFELYKEWIATVDSGDSASHVPAMRALVARLPAPNRATLVYLLAHLRRVADHAEANKMSEGNLAIVFAPGLVRCQDEMVSVRDFKAQGDVVVSLLTQFHAIFDE